MVHGRNRARSGVRPADEASCSAVIDFAWPIVTVVFPLRLVWSLVRSLRESF